MESIQELLLLNFSQIVAVIRQKHEHAGNKGKLVAKIITINQLTFIDAICECRDMHLSIISKYDLSEKLLYF